MKDDEFEWDEKKAAENYAKHGIGFEHAKLVFNDIFSVEGSTMAGPMARTASPSLAWWKVSFYSSLIPSVRTASG